MHAECRLETGGIMKIISFQETSDVERERQLKASNERGKNKWQRERKKKLFGDNVSKGIEIKKWHYFYARAQKPIHNMNRERERMKKE